jgi:hypothetical protein
VASIDVSRADAQKLSQREIIIVFNYDSDKLVFLRLPSNGWKTPLNRFFLIPNELLSHQVVDMRLPNTAYVTALKDSKGERR